MDSCVSTAEYARAARPVEVLGSVSMGGDVIDASTAVVQASVSMVGYAVYASNVAEHRSVSMATYERDVSFVVDLGSANMATSEINAGPVVVLASAYMGDNAASAQSVKAPLSASMTRDVLDAGNVVVASTKEFAKTAKNVNATRNSCCSQLTLKYNVPSVQALVGFSKSQKYYYRWRSHRWRINHDVSPESN